jgi:FkbM family methyltransferase
MHPRLSVLALPLTRAEVPRWPKLIEMVSSDWDERLKGAWREHAKVVVRGKGHHQLMNLDLSDWAERMTFFLGRYYELGVLETLDLLLRPGDRFVDIGANIGMITLHARSLVGDRGRIDCFEPNPDCVAAIRANLALNAITNVVVHPCGLGDRAGPMTLHFASEHSGTATLADTGDDTVRAFSVDVEVGDEALQELPRVIKIDVEGFELQVLRGLRRTLADAAPFVITEVIESQLARAGAGTSDLVELFAGHGYRAFGIGLQRNNRLRNHMVLTPVDDVAEFARFKDFLWVHHERVGELGGRVH